MKMRLLAAAAVAAAVMGPGVAGAHQDGDCLDIACSAVSLVAADPATIEGGSTVAPKYGVWGIDLAGRDLSVRPGDSFYRYANGTWDANAVIPADRTRYGNFDRLTVLSESRTRAIIETAAAGHSTDPDAAKIGAAYNAFMDEARVEALDAKPLARDLAAIKAAKTRAALALLMADANRGFQSGIFGAAINADGKAIVDYETQVAQVSWTRAQRRDRDKTYNPMSLADLETAAPEFPWKGFVARSNLGGVNRFIVTTNTAVPKIAKIYAATPVETLQAWAAFHLVDQAAPYLSKRFVDARFAFRNHELAGQPEQQPRWKRGVAFVNGVLGESVGRLYVAQYFPPESKAKMEGLIHDLETALAGRIQRLTWMSPETKAKALEKLAKFTVKVGYPVKWRDYRAYAVTAGDLYGDAARYAAYDWARDVGRMNGPVDKQEWGMTPQTVNAYYNSTNNEIVFPAAILQAPFFDPNADMAVNFGGIGGVIGHEMTHGFDDQGRKSNGDGALVDWWTAEDAAKFKVQSDRLGAQYSSYEPVPGFHIKGEQTMGENIADLGGQLIALDAYHTYLHGQPAPVLDGVTGDQRVLLAWAQVWRQKQRPDAAIQQTKSDPHSAAEFRVIGPSRNNDTWYDAFGVQPGEAYYLAPDQRVRIW
jgi:putative endopeptidase